MNNDLLINGLKKQAREIEYLLGLRNGSPEFEAWKTKTSRLLERISRKDSSYLKDFQAIKYSLMIFSQSTPESAFQKAYNNGLLHAKAVLVSIVDELEEFGLPMAVEESARKSIKNEVTVNLNQVLHINVKTVLENNLTVSQYHTLQEILNTQDGNERESKLSEFLGSLGSGIIVEMLKTVLLGG